MTYTLTQLRADIYQVVDKVLKTGVPAVVERNGKFLKIVPVEAPSRLDRLKPHPDYIVGDPGGLVHLDWSREWKS